MVEKYELKLPYVCMCILERKKCCCLVEFYLVCTFGQKGGGIKINLKCYGLF